MGARGPDGGGPHRRVPRRPRALLELLRPALRHARRQAPQRRPPRAGGDGGAGAVRRGDHAEHRHAASQGGDARADRGARQHRQLLMSELWHGVQLEEASIRLERAQDGVPRCEECAAAAEARCRAVRRAAPATAARARARAMRRRGRAAVRRLLAGGPSGRGPAPAHARGRRTVAIITRGPTPLEELADVRLSGDVVVELQALLGALGSQARS